MGGEIEAMADPGSAALVADSLDVPVAGHPGHGACPNCAAPLTGKFCANCGQKAHLHRSLAHVGEEFLHGITHFDGKAWTTLPMLVFRPGRLTRDYIMGRRARHIAPVPLFLLVVFLMFFVFSFVHLNPVGLDQQIGIAQARTAEAEAKKSLTALDRDLAAARAKGDTAEVATLTRLRAPLVAVRDRAAARVAGKTTAPIDLSAELRRELADNNVDINLGNASLDAKARAALQNPELVLYKIQGKAYKLSFLLVPLSLPWLWLIFAWKRGVRLYDHAIFALYSISFMSLLFVVGSIALELGVTAGLFWSLLLFVAPVAHIFVQLKGAYALSNFSAAWRTFALSIASLITLGMYAALMVVLGITG